jgi:endonuclease/exonuclease/phosphatase family metal-dependent hydrolase
MSYNVLNGGGEDRSAPRWLAEVEAIRETNPGVLLVQEARGFDLDGAAGLYEAERQLGMRGLLACAPRTGQHTAVFLAPDVRPVRFQPDSDHFHHALAQATIAVPGLATPITVASIHLSPLSPALRLAEVGWLAGLAAPGSLAVIAGDANSLAPGDPEPQDWGRLPAHFRVRYLDPATGTADRTALRFLHAAGFVDAAAALDDAAPAPTVPTRGFPEAEFVPFRSDHVLLSPAISGALSAYRVLDEDRTHQASDHLPVVVDLDLTRLAEVAEVAA